MSDKLTAKQEAFVQNLIRGMSQREAYKAAYDTKSTKDNSIDVLACRLFKKDKVRLRYEQLNDKIITKVEKRTLITKEKVLKEIAHIAFDDMSNYLEYKTVLTKVGTDENDEPLYEYRTVIELKDSKTISTKSVSEISLSKDGTFKFKLYSKDTALYKLGEHLGLWDSPTNMQIKLEELRLKQDAAKLTNW